MKKARKKVQKKTQEKPPTTKGIPTESANRAVPAATNAAPSAKATPPNGSFGTFGCSTGGGVVNTGENSLATDFSREGLGNIDTDEVDPIAEADAESQRSKEVVAGTEARARDDLMTSMETSGMQDEFESSENSVDTWRFADAAKLGSTKDDDGDFGDEADEARLKTSARCPRAAPPGAASTSSLPRPCCSIPAISTPSAVFPRRPKWWSIG